MPYILHYTELNILCGRQIVFLDEGIYWRHCAVGCIEVIRRVIWHKWVQIFRSKDVQTLIGVAQPH